MSQQLELLPDEVWWGGAVADGTAMPFGHRHHQRDLATSAGHPGADGSPEGGANQSAPLLVSSAGRYLWSERPFAFVFDGAGGLIVSDDGDRVLRGEGGADLRGAFRAATRHFPPSGRTPAPAMLSAPQYNTWIEMPYRPTQQAVLTYVRGLLDAGFPPGPVMIDDRWSIDYGDWRFAPDQFAEPGAMVEQLHAWGCAVMLWLVPFVSPDSPAFRTLRSQGLLIKRPDGQPAIREWWNGYSAVLDLTHPDGAGWLREELDALRSAYGIDGFKFDAGDLRDYRDDDVTAEGGGPVAQTEAYGLFGAGYDFNEFRAGWKCGGQPLAQRLHDKPATWGIDGLGSLIPEGIAQGLIGHPYVCPDMIGGGELNDVSGRSVDPELFVRYAQVAALFPMMQFSMAPQRVLDADHLNAVRAAVDLHQNLVPEILRLAEHAARTGEPILRAVAYHHPGYESVADEFLLGEDLLCASVLEAGATTRRVLIPPGLWVDPDGQEVVGPATVEVSVGLESIPRWRRTS